MKKTLHLAQAVLASSLFAASIVYADTVLMSQYDEPVPNTQLVATQTGSIEITSTGKVNATNIDGIKVDTGSITITIDPTNTTAGNNAIIASGTGHGINILNGAGKNTPTIITVNSGSNITTTGTGNAIVIADTTATINNSGGLFGGGNAIDIPAGGVNATIFNSGSGAKIQGGIVSAVPTILVEGGVANGGTGLTLTNDSGALIANAGNGDTIQVNQSFTSITNNANSTIQSANGNAISIAPTAVGAITGDIFNYGLINSTGGAQTIYIANIFNGTINNNSGGVIQATGNGGNVIFANNSFSAINNNSGAIISATGTDFGINVTGNSPGTVNNAGTIQTNAVSFLYNTNTTSTGLNNTGTITTTSAANPAIWGRNGSTVTGIVYNTVGYGIVNSNIISNTGGGAAIDLQTDGPNINIPLLQLGGTITGNVLLATNVNPTTPLAPTIPAFTMTGGTINGNVLSGAANASILNLSGGSITGSTTLGNVAGNVVNLSGSKLQALNGGTGNDTFNLSGGSFTVLNGGGGADILNINGNFTQTAVINNIPTIKVNNGLYTVNAQINGTSTFNINAGGSMVTNFNPLNGSLAANINIAANGGLTINPGSTFTVAQVNNNGLLSTQPGGTLSVTGNYSQNAGAGYYPVVSNGGATGLLTTTGTATFNAGSTMNPSLLTGGVFVAPGAQYTVVNAAAGVVGAPTLVQPQSALVFFSQTVNPNNIVLTLNLEPIAGVAEGDTAQAIGAALDPLLFGGTTNPELAALLGQLELMPDNTTLTQALLQLAPSLNNALPTSSRICMDNALDSVQQRLEQLHGLGPFSTEEDYREVRDYELYNGVNYGDRNVINFGSNHFNAWAKVYGTIVDQHKREQVEGFLADAAGIGIGWDWRLTNQALVGLALSGNKVETTDDTTAQNKIETWSYQATFYGWFEPMQSVYFDTMLAIASHKYDTTRNMQIGSFVGNATANFIGTQYGAQTDIGYAIKDENWVVAPYVRGRYTYLHISDYSEVGAGGIDLSVQNGPIDEMIAGVGLRIAGIRDYIQAVYVPEATATLLYDFAGKEQAIQANFLGGGGFFYVNGLKPAQIIQQYSLGVNAYTNDGYNAALKFIFEYRNEMFAYNGYLQLSYQWD
ncbi:MAG: autotransporter domain-containing protein [Proteobacteria bacterium]|nr:autotransporter domain-containing protein [Pseudomonadota bacterium]